MVGGGCDDCMLRRENRGRGLGTKLVEECLRRAVDDCRVMVVNAGTEHAVKFYDRLGWERAQEVGITHWVDLSRME